MRMDVEGKVMVVLRVCRLADQGQGRSSVARTWPFFFFFIWGRPLQRYRAHSTACTVCEDYNSSWWECFADWQWS